LVKADYVTGDTITVRDVGNFRAEAGVFLDVSRRDKSFLILMELADCPGGEPSVN
jgi:hypothetical protein